MTEGRTHLTHDDIAEIAFGVLIAAAEEGVTDWNIVAHAVARNVLLTEELEADT